MDDWTNDLKAMDINNSFKQGSTKSNFLCSKDIQSSTSQHHEITGCIHTEITRSVLWNFKSIFGSWKKAAVNCIS